MGSFPKKDRRGPDKVATAFDAFFAIFVDIHWDWCSQLGRKDQTRAADDVFCSVVPGTHVNVVWVGLRDWRTQVRFDSRRKRFKPRLQLAI
jgi:hypothetical protein